MTLPGSHYQLIRTCHEYRMMCMLEELEAERLPSWCQESLPQDALTISPQESVAPRPIVNVTYQMGAEKTPAFKNLQEQINLLGGRFNKYFEIKKDKSKKIHTKREGKGIEI